MYHVHYPFWHVHRNYLSHSSLYMYHPVGTIHTVRVVCTIVTVDTT
jgi:hypothetical protein